MSSYAYLNNFRIKTGNGFSSFLVRSHELPEVRAFGSNGINASKPHAQITVTEIDGELFCFNWSSIMFFTSTPQSVDLEKK